MLGGYVWKSFPCKHPPKNQHNNEETPEKKYEKHMLFSFFISSKLKARCASRYAVRHVRCLFPRGSPSICLILSTLTSDSTPLSRSEHSAKATVSTENDEIGDATYVPPMARCLKSQRPFLNRPTSTIQAAAEHCPLLVPPSECMTKLQSWARRLPNGQSKHCDQEDFLSIVRFTRKSAATFCSLGRQMTGSPHGCEAVQPLSMM